MTLALLEKRVKNLELRQRLLAKGALGSELKDYSTPALLKLMIEETLQMKSKADAAGNVRMALACVQALYRPVELAAKLRGEVDETRRTNIMQLNLDLETGTKIAETFLWRHNLKGDSR
jgi:hypothetical protein